MRHPSVDSVTSVSERDNSDGRGPTRAQGHEEAREQADAAQREEETLRARWEATQEGLRERFDQPISSATAITQRTLAWFPVRVWRHFLQHNGFLLAAGVSYQALFATFAAIYVAFAITGLWLGGSAEAVTGLINLINLYIPGLIADEGGLFDPRAGQRGRDEQCRRARHHRHHRPRHPDLDGHRLRDVRTPRGARHLRPAARPAQLLLPQGT